MVMGIADSPVWLFFRSFPIPPHCPLSCSAYVPMFLLVVCASLSFSKTVTITPPFPRRVPGHRGFSVVCPSRPDERYLLSPPDGRSIILFQFFHTVPFIFLNDIVLRAMPTLFRVRQPVTCKPDGTCCRVIEVIAPSRILPLGLFFPTIRRPLHPLSFFSPRYRLLPLPFIFFLVPFAVFALS